jgi:hypothetical protein
MRQRVCACGDFALRPVCLSLVVPRVWLVLTVVGLGRLLEVRVAAPTIWPQSSA